MFVRPSVTNVLQVHFPIDNNNHSLEKVIEYDMEIPQSNTSDQPMTLGGRATEHKQSKKNNKKKTERQSKATNSLLCVKMIQKPAMTLRNE